jgi:hypothetical protein
MTNHQTKSGPRARTLKVEHLDGTDFTLSSKAQIRLKGKWLASIFQPGSRLMIEVVTGTIVIR